MENAALAERLEALAALLDLNGSGYYTVRAYRRAAELIRSTPADVDALVRAGRVRELAGIGPGIEARLRELVETGELAELRELEEQALPELVGVGALLGLSPEADARARARARDPHAGAAARRCRGRSVGQRFRDRPEDGSPDRAGARRARHGATARGG